MIIIHITTYYIMNRETSSKHAEKCVDCMGFMISNTCSGIKKLCSTLKSKKIHPVTEPSKDSKCVLDWQSSTPTYGPYHWWPWKSHEHLGKKTYMYNNLYATGGALYKYDRLFCQKAVEYQKKYYFRSDNSSSSDRDWAGFCDKAAILSCLWEHPIYGVTVVYNDTQMFFTREDISALMIIACDNTITNIREFYGKRYNGYRNQNIHEPYPKKLLCLLQYICKKKTPFCVDNNNDTCVWNYPMSNVQVCIYNYEPEEITHMMEEEKKYIPTKGTVEYYNFIMTSDAYPMETINVWGWVHTYKKRVTEGWISKKTPDFLWRTFKQKKKWEGASKINPEVNCSFIHELYQRSLHKDQIYNM